MSENMIEYLTNGGAAKAAKLLIAGSWFLVSGLDMPAQDCRSIFRGDQALTGATGSGPQKRPKLLWTFKTGDNVKSSPVACGNTMVTGSTDGYVYALDPEGKLIWKFNTDNPVEAPVLILDQTVYVGNLQGTLFAIDISNGKEKWRYGTEGQISGSANWWRSGDKTYILFGSYDFYLHCVEAYTGKGVWKYESDNFINGAASVVGNKAIFGGCDGFLHLVDVNSGTAVDKISVATYVPGSVPVSGGLAFVGDYDGGFTCISLDQKKIIWKYENEAMRLPFLASAAIKGDMAITGSRDKNVYSFDRNTGALKWKYNTGEKVDASPLICGEAVLIVNMRGDLIMLDTRNGRPLWTYETGSPVSSNPVIVNGRIYLGADDGNIYCFGL